MIENNIKKISAKLKEIIDRNGPDYLTDEPYEIYLELLQNENTDKKTASLILYALVNNVQSETEPDGNPVLLSKIIQEKCSLNAETADYLSNLFLALYSKENEDSWKKKNLEGLS